MVKIDLITGFLGSGKTTFIRHYVNYLLKKGERVGIIENDYGAINVDMMLLADLKEKGVGLEMVSGGCDYDCHKRRFKTKLITMALLGYQRVIVEPSGIFDVDEFYDLLCEDELYDRYQIDNVLAIVEANLSATCSKESDILLASQAATAGKVILSKVNLADEEMIQKTINHLNNALAEIHCRKSFSLEENVIAKPFEQLSDEDFELILHSGFEEIGYEKRISMDNNGFQSLFFMNVQGETTEIIKAIERLWKDESAGKLIRIKGFLEEENGFIEINSTHDVLSFHPVSQGQRILIVIGEELNIDVIDSYFKADYSTGSVNKIAKEAIEK